MSAILDQNVDVSSQALATMSQGVSFPAYVGSPGSLVKAASCVDSRKTMPMTAFACPSLRLFPVNTKAATWLSTLYFLHEGSKLPTPLRKQANENLVTATDFWGIRNDVAKLAAELEIQAQDETDKLPDAKFAFVWVNPDGTKVRNLPIRNMNEIKRAAEWLHEHREEFRYRDRQKIAQRILEAADENQMSVPNEQWVEKQAGRGICEPLEVIQQIMSRSVALDNNLPFRREMEKLAAQVRENPEIAMRPEALVTLATTLDEIDTAYNLRHKYASDRSSLKPPEDFCFRYTHTEIEKLATSSVRLVTGRVWSQDDLSRLKKADLENLFGSDFVDEVSDGFDLDRDKLAEVAETLPRPDAELLESLLEKSAGADPLVDPPTAVGFTTEDFKRLLDEAS